MERAVKQGYESYTNIIGGDIGAKLGEQYISELNTAINVLNDDINAFSGFNTPIEQLKGDIAEYWHSDTFNINAKLNNSQFKTLVDRSHDYASADITSNWGDKFGLKYLRNGTETARAQSISHFERFCKYKYESGKTDLNIEDFLKERGYESSDILNDPIYSGQIRIIPANQLKEATEYLKYKIAKERLIRPEQVERYKETLDLLSSKIKAPDGTESIELTTKEAELIARIAKEGKFDAKDIGITTEDLITYEHILKQGLKAGKSAAIITMVLKTAPQIYKLIDELIKKGYINEGEFKELGFNAISGAAEGYIRGFISAALVTSCQSGLFGEALKTINPNIIAGLTVVLYSTMKDSFLVVKGSISRYELTYNLSRNIFVTSCAIGFGAFAQTFLPAIPCAYLLGNFVGSAIGSFAYIAWDSAFMSFCVSSGFTLFGIVKQDYKLPEHIIKEIGIEIFEYEQYFIDEYQYETYDIEQYEGDFISFIRRGVIGVHQIGYIED